MSGWAGWLAGAVAGRWPPRSLGAAAAPPPLPAQRGPPAPPPPAPPTATLPCAATRGRTAADAHARAVRPPPPASAGAGGTARGVVGCGVVYGKERGGQMPARRAYEDVEGGSGGRGGWREARSLGRSVCGWLAWRRRAPLSRRGVGDVPSNYLADCVRLRTVALHLGAILAESDVRDVCAREYVSICRLSV